MPFKKRFTKNTPLNVLILLTSKRFGTLKVPKRNLSISLENVAIDITATLKRSLIIGEDGIFFRGGAGPQFSPRRGCDFST